jgi:hypothetical protein
MIFKPMKQEDVRLAIAGHQDVLKLAYEQNEKLFKALSCPSCGGEVMAVVNARTPFKEGSIVPNCLAKCKVCSVEFEPHTGIVVTMPGR